MLYRILKNMINRGNTDGLADSIDVIYAAGKLTEEQGHELVNLLNAATTSTTKTE